MIVNTVVTNHDPVESIELQSEDNIIKELCRIVCLSSLNLPVMEEYGDDE